MDNSMILLCIANCVKLSFVGGGFANLHATPYIGRFLNVLAMSVCKGVPFSVMVGLMWHLRWPDIKMLDELFPGTFKEQQEIYKGRFTGRSRRLDVDWFRKALKSRRCTKINRGQSRTVYQYISDCIRHYLEPRENILPVYLYEDKSKILKKVLIKKISYKCEETEREDRKTAVNEILAGSLRHFAVVPLIAMAEDTEKKRYYLMFPYMDNRDLRQLIDADNKRLERAEDVVLDFVCRLKILCQISCAMAYLHKDVHNVRGAISHGDITTTNILIDANKDARLADFGLSNFYNYGERGVRNFGSLPVGTPGYYDETRTDYLNTETDIRNFGIVLLEMLTGELPFLSDKDESSAKMPLLNKSKQILQEDYEDDMARVWEQGNVRNKVFELAENCRKGNISNAEEIRNELEKCMRDYDLKPAKGEKCRACMVTDKMKDWRMLNHDRCTGSLEVCMNCVKNSHINPMACHDVCCTEVVTSPIGHDWAAIFIAGYDSDTETLNMFKRDAREIKRMCLSKKPLSIGVREENSCIVSTKQELTECITSLNKNCHTCISTLFVYYSGHFTGTAFRLKNGEILQSTALGRMIYNLNCKRYICVFDCCYGPDIGQGQGQSQNLVIQLKACTSSQKVDIGNTDGLSKFTKLFLQALSGPPGSNLCDSECEHCKEFSADMEFVSIPQLKRYIHKHWQDQNVQCYPTHQTYGELSELNNKVAYYQQDCTEVEFKLLIDTNELYKVEQLPSNMKTMLKTLAAKFGGKLGIDTGLADVLQVTLFPDVKCTELTSIEQIENAHARNLDIFVQLRGVKDINNGKVLIFKDRSDKIFSTLKKWSVKKQARKIYSLQELEEDRIGENHVRIDLRNDGIRKMRRFIIKMLSTDTSERTVMKYLEKNILNWTSYPQIKGKDFLVLTFTVNPSASDEEKTEIFSTKFTIFLDQTVPDRKPDMELLYQRQAR